MSRDPVQCPTCGWTGEPSDLETGDDDRFCPICDELIEFVE